MGQFTKLSEQILGYVGGTENISYVTHCATRLRINPVDWEKVDEENIKNVEGVKGIVKNSDQIQIIIGPRVSDAYYDFLDVSGWKEGNTVKETKASAKAAAAEKTGVFGRIITKVANFFAPIMMPMIPAILVGGLARSIYTIIVMMTGIDGMTNGTLRLIMCIFNAGFNFIPIYVGFTMAQHLRMKPIMGALLGAMTMTSTYTEGMITDFLGIAVQQNSYSGTLIPIMLGVGFMYFVDKFLKKVIPDVLSFFLVPLLTMLIVAPVFFVVLGPIGIYVGTFLGTIVLWLVNHAGFIALPLLTIAQPYMVMIGADKVVNPLAAELYSTISYDPLIAPASGIANVAVGACALAIAFMAMDKTKKGQLASSGATALCGITEPAFYGGLLLNPKSLIGLAAGSGFAGIVAGILGMRNFARGACYGLLTLPLTIPDSGEMKYMFIALVVYAIAFAATFAATLFVLKREEKKQLEADQA